jgi:hypothetical protein
MMHKNMFPVSRDGYKDTKGSDVDNGPESAGQEQHMFGECSVKTHLHGSDLV